MIGQIKLIGGVKTIVPLDKNLVPELDLSTPDNALLKFSNADNSIVDTGWCGITSHNGRIKSLVPSTYMKFNVGYGNSYEEAVFNCMDRCQLVVGNSNNIQGQGWHTTFGNGNLSNALYDSTVFQFGAGNRTTSRISGLGLQIGIGNCSTSTNASSFMTGMNNSDVGLHDLPAECVACQGISENYVYGASNTIGSAWTNVFGGGNRVDCWASINSYCYDPVTGCYQCTINTKVVGTNHVFGNSNIICGAGNTTVGHSNRASFALNSVMVGISNVICGRPEAGFKYNQFLIGINNTSCGYDNTAIGSSNCLLGTNQTKLGSYGNMAAGAGAAIAIGHSANASYCCGFTASEVKTGGVAATLPSGLPTPGYNQGNEIIGGMHIISGKGTLAQFSEAMTVFGHTGRNYHGYIHFYDVGAMCTHITSKYDGTARDDNITNPVMCDGTVSLPYSDWNQWHVSGRDFWSDIFMSPTVTNLAAFANCHVNVSIRVIW